MELDCCNRGHASSGVRKTRTYESMSGRSEVSPLSLNVELICSDCLHVSCAARGMRTCVVGHYSSNEGLDCSNCKYGAVFRALAESV